MIYGYTRVSTAGQAIKGNSLEEQAAMIRERYPDAVIVSESSSGAKQRPIFDELAGKCVSGDVLVMTTLDRFCRTTKEGLSFIDNLMEKGVRIHILNLGLIEDSPMGRLIITCLLSFAEFERSQIIERTQSGKAAARQKAGFRDGRPKKYSHAQIEHALSLLTEHSYNEVSKMTGISRSTLIREKNKRQSP